MTNFPSRTRNAQQFVAFAKAKAFRRRKVPVGHPAGFERRSSDLADAAKRQGGHRATGKERRPQLLERGAILWGEAGPVRYLLGRPLPIPTSQRCPFGSGVPASGHRGPPSPRRSCLQHSCSALRVREPDADRGRLDRMDGDGIPTNPDCDANDPQTGHRCRSTARNRARGRWVSVQPLVYDGRF